MYKFSPLPASSEERLEKLAEGDGILIERIISTGQRTAEGEWFDQVEDEWVVLIQGEATLAYEDGTRQHLGGGDSVFLPAHVKHRVEHTSVSPPCIWIAVHANMHAC